MKNDAIESVSYIHGGGEFPMSLDRVNQQHRSFDHR